MLRQWPVYEITRVTWRVCVGNCVSFEMLTNKHGGCAVFPDCLRVFLVRWRGSGDGKWNWRGRRIFLSHKIVYEERNFPNSCYFEVTVPVYELDVFRSHFRMTRTTFELLAQMIIPSEHIPNGNAFGRPVVEPDKQIAMALWMMANQETHRQISDRFDVSLSSVSRCFRRVCRALVDLLPDLVRWPNGRYLYFLFIFFITQNKCLSLCKALIRNFHLLHL